MSNEKSVPEKSHAELGASVASRWTVCPGSIRLGREVPTPPQSDYALEGTRAHSVAQLCLEKKVDASFFVGMTIEKGIVDETMADFVQIFVDHCRQYLDDPTYICFIEQKFNLGSLNPPGPMFGTADFVAYDTVNHEVIVVDLKYGQGVVVEVIGNKQLRYYGLGAVLSPELQNRPIKLVRLTIVQPRVGHPDGVIRSETIDYVDLIGFAGELMADARETLKPDAKLVAGDHCRFCPASGICPEQRSRALAVAQQEFSVEEYVPPAPSTIPLPEFFEMLPKLAVLDNWAAAMRARAEDMLRRGETVPGFKMVAKRATRKWDDAGAVIAGLEADGYEPDEYNKEPELKSPAQLEKLMGKKKFASSPVIQHVTKISSGYNMVPETDPRPSVALTGGEEFAALPSGEE